MLCCSDIARWDEFKEIFDKTKPDITLFAGDLTSDGSAEFLYVQDIPEFQVKLRELKNKKREVIEKHWNYVLERSSLINKYSDAPETRSIELKKLEQKYRVTIAEYNAFRLMILDLEQRFYNHPKFLEKAKKHAEKFYESLEYSADTCDRVFVVKGDHDEDFEGNYNVQRIKNCEEISGKISYFKGLSFLGLGFNEAHYLRTLRPLVDRFLDQIDVVLTHAEQRRLPLISRIKPRIILRGHFELGKYSVNEVPVVSSRFPYCYAIIETEGKKIQAITIRKYCEYSKNWQECNLSCIYPNDYVFKKWPWMQRIDVECPIGYRKL